MIAKWLCRCGSVALLVFGLNSCQVFRNPNNAPAIGSIGGIAVGAVIGADSGHAATGAFLGSLLGRSGGQIVRNESDSRAYRSQYSPLEGIPSSLRAAGQFEKTLRKDCAALSRQRATSPQAVTRSAARQRLAEIKGWVSLLNSYDRSLAKAIGSTQGPADVSRLLRQRSEIHGKLAAIQQHESCFRALAS